MPEFSPLQRPPFSEYWDNEEAFSAWLADEDNIHYLREVLGLHGLVAEELEREVEGYFVDIYARDETFGVEVVVENQFGRSDHDHWGKANTYSSFDLRAANRYDTYHRWLLSAADALRSVFSKRIRNHEE